MGVTNNCFVLCSVDCKDRRSLRMRVFVIVWLQSTDEEEIQYDRDSMGSNSSAQKHMKIFKLRTPSGHSKYGLACRNLKELKEKGCKKFQLPLSGTRVCLYEDGTEISDDYLTRLPDNTELVLLAAGQTWRGFVTDIDRLLDVFYKSQRDVAEAAQKLLSGEQAPKTQKLLVDFIHNLTENISAENREEDELWFEGIEPRYKSKSSYMRSGCESRIRSYMKEVQNSAASVDPAAREGYRNLAETLSSALKAAKYNGFYFDRTGDKASRLCTAEGWFSCQGAFDVDDCASRHSINPYSNRESRILFSTWNLDHRIEKKRAILPRLMDAVRESNGRQVNWQYFFNLLFTMENLKLVHIACHKKSAHNLRCDDAMIYLPRKMPRPANKSHLC